MEKGVNWRLAVEEKQVWGDCREEVVPDYLLKWKHQKMMMKYKEKQNNKD